LADLAQQVADAAPHLADDLAAARRQVDQLNAGAHAVASGADRLHRGAAKASGAASALDGGLYRLSTGARQLDSGLASLSDGTHQLATGPSTLEEGAGQLANGPRQRLYEAAVALVAEQGFSATTVDDIAERAGVVGLVVALDWLMFQPDRDIGDVESALLAIVRIRVAAA
jgi:putative membrane protein